MLQIVQGDLKKVQEEMSQFSKKAKDKVKDLKKQHTEEIKDSAITAAQTMQEIERLTELQNTYYSTSKVIPVRVGGMVINYKAYEKFMKAMSKVPFVEVQVGTSYRVEYPNGGIEFFDLSETYQEFQHIPVAELSRESDA